MDGRFVATLALDYPWHLCLEDLVTCLQAKVPPLREKVSGSQYCGDRMGAEEAYIISVSGYHYGVAYVSEPAPAARFATAASYAVEGWPDAAEDLARHRAQVVVSNLKPARNFHAAIDAAGGATLIAGVLAELGPSRGVYWAAGEALHTSEQFIALMDTLLKDSPPVEAWVTVRAHLNDFTLDTRHGIGVSTLGLNQFCGREVEIETVPVFLTRARDRVRAVTADILKNGPNLSDGSTIRIGDSDLIRVNLTDEGRFSARQPVITLSVVVDETEVGEPVLAPPADSTPLFDGRRRNRPFAT